MPGPIVLAILLVLPLASLPGPADTGHLPAAGAQTAEKPWPPPGVYGTDDHIKPPVVSKRVNPSYTAAAMRAKIQGKVIMQAVVQADGTVSDVRVTRSLDREHGLDDEAVRTVKLWKFEPGTKDGTPVPVLVTVVMAFTLKK